MQPQRGLGTPPRHMVGGHMSGRAIRTTGYAVSDARTGPRRYDFCGLILQE